MSAPVLALGTAWAFGVRVLGALRESPTLRVVGWHRIDDRESGLSTPLPDFESHLAILEQWGARIVRLEEGVAGLRDGTLPERAVALTFDDGYLSVLETAWPRLAARGWAATLFVSSAYIGRAKRFPWDEPDLGSRLAGESDLRSAVAAGLTLGSHTVSHRWLPSLSDRECRHELADARHALEHLVGERIISLAYPAGGWTSRVIALAEEAGYEIGVTTDRGFNRDGRKPLSLRRGVAPRDAGAFALALDGGLNYLRPIDRVRSRLRQPLQDMPAPWG